MALQISTARHYSADRLLPRLVNSKQKFGDRQQGRWHRNASAAALRILFTWTVTHDGYAAIPELRREPETNVGKMLYLIQTTYLGKFSLGHPWQTGPVVTVRFSRQAGECFMEEIATAFVLVTHEEGMDTEDFYYDSADGSFQYMYSIEVPAGVYDVTASADGMTTLIEVNFTIAGTDPLTLDFDF
jgi:hypothetical protein